MRFIELKKFREANKNKWPSVSSSDKSERALYMLGYKARKAFQNGNLNEEKEVLLRSIGFPLEDKITRANDWKTEAKKLINFLIVEKKMAKCEFSKQRRKSVIPLLLFK